MRHGLDNALERFRQYLRSAGLRHTPERDLVVEVALARKGHFSAEEFVQDLRAAGVSKATAYRSLPLLVEAGIVQPTLLSGETRRYEAAFGRKHHDHLVCSRCGRVIEFHFEAFEMLQTELAARYGFELTAHFHELIGVCRDCRGKDLAETKSQQRGRR